MDEVVNIIPVTYLLAIVILKVKIILLKVESKKYLSEIEDYLLNHHRITKGDEHCSLFLSLVFFVFVSFKTFCGTYLTCQNTDMLWLHSLIQNIDNGCLENWKPVDWGILSILHQDKWHLPGI